VDGTGSPADIAIEAARNRPILRARVARRVQMGEGRFVK
jgi:hypothetical protein